MTPPPTIASADAERVTLEVADELFFTQGVAAVTMAKIRDESGVSLRRLYSMYPSKSSLVAAWLEHRHQRWMAGFQGRVDARLAAGDDPVDASFSALEAWMTETGFRGCGFINTHAEANELTDEHRRIIQMHKKAVATYLSSLTPIGEPLAIFIDGAIVQAAIFESPEPIRVAHRSARTLTQGTRS